MNTARQTTWIVLFWAVMHAAWASDVQIQDPYVRAVPPGQRVTAAFFVAVNASTQPRAIVKAQTDTAERAELHEHIHDGGVMRMREVPRVVIPAGGRLAFEPGGYHVMLIGLKRALQPGERIDLTLVLDDGSRITVHPEVRRVQPHGGAAHQHHSTNH